MNIVCNFQYLMRYFIVFIGYKISLELNQQLINTSAMVYPNWIVEILWVKTFQHLLLKGIICVTQQVHFQNLLRPSFYNSEGNFDYGSKELLFRIMAVQDYVTSSCKINCITCQESNFHSCSFLFYTSNGNLLMETLFYNLFCAMGFCFSIKTALE